jgi:hypothetical protein
MPTLFLSHSGADTEAARALKTRIEECPAATEAGLKVWFDKDDLKAGKSWQAQLAATIEKEADAFAVLLGASGVVNWVDAEVEVALSRATTLHSVWRRHKTQSEDLLQAYAEVQGVSGALAYEAEKVRGRLSEAQKEMLFPIFARLIRRGELGGATRRKAQKDEFDGEKQKLITHLSSEDSGRLLLAGERSVEIAHEALITQWPWLRTEGRKHASDIEELARLMEKAKAWAKQATDDRPKYLATGAELETFSALAERRKDWLSNVEHEFVAACRMRETEEKQRKEQRRKRELEEARKLAEAQKKVAQRTRIGLIVAGVLLVGALGAAWFAREQRAIAEQSTKEAQANLITARQSFSSAIAALAVAELDQRPVDAAKLALAAWPRPGAMDLPKRDVTGNTVWRSLGALYERQRIAARATITSVAFSPDGKFVLTGSLDAPPAYGTPRRARKSAPSRGMRALSFPLPSASTANSC